VPAFGCISNRQRGAIASAPAAPRHVSYTPRGASRQRHLSEDRFTCIPGLETPCLQRWPAAAMHEGEITELAEQRQRIAKVFDPAAISGPLERVAWKNRLLG